MSQVLADLFYTKDHEWVRKTKSPKVVQVGITDFAQASLGDVTFVQLPSVGAVLEKGKTFGSVESVKAVSDLYAPLSGKVLRVNNTLSQDPSPVNSDPYNSAWMIELEITNEGEFSSLMAAGAYEKISV